MSDFFFYFDQICDSFFSKLINYRNIYKIVSVYSWSCGKNHPKPGTSGVSQDSFNTQNWSNKIQCNSWLQ